MAEFDLKTAESLLKSHSYNELFLYCSNGAKSCNADAMEMLSLCFLYGYGTAAAEANAILMCTHAAELGSKKATEALNRFSAAQRISAYYELSEKGDTYAALCLALEYKSGRNINRNMKEAFRLFGQAANDYPRARFEMGLCYESGRGVEHNAQCAIDEYISAAENNYAPAKKKLEKLREITAQITSYKKGAEHLIAGDLYSLGRFYENGVWVEQDESYAFSLYSTAAEQGHADAQFRMAYMSEHGIGTMSKPKKAVALYKAAAERGSVRAKLRMAYCAEAGIGMDKDAATAVKLYSQCLPNSIAMYYLADCYERGLSTDAAAKNAYDALYTDSITSTDAEIKEYSLEPQNADMHFHLGFLYECKHDDDSLINAAEHYTYAAEQGNMYAYYRLGRCYEYGLGVNLDEKKACELYNEAAMCSYVPACYRLAMLIYNDDKERAVKLLETAAEAGHAPSLCILALQCEAGRYMSKSNAYALTEKAKRHANTIMPSDININTGAETPAEKNFLCGLLNEIKCTSSQDALRLYGASSREGFVPAIYRLARMYDKGECGVDINHEYAYKLYANAAAKGHAESLCGLGECYENGFGTVQDDNAAFECYTAAATAGSAQGLYNLGRFYETGRCCLQDRSEALSLYRAASKAGCKAALERIKHHARAMKLISLDIYAARRGDPSAEYRLGEAYEAGKDIDQNTEEAYRWYELSAKHGYAEAQYKLGMKLDTANPFRAKQAETWYSMAAAQHHAGAMHRLQELEEERAAYKFFNTLHKDFDGMKCQFPKHIAAIERLANKGVPRAQHLYAKYFESDLCKSKSSETAMFWYKRAAEHDHADSLYELGEHYFYGIGTKVNYTAAKKSYERAAIKKHTRAYVMLGKCYEHGCGTNYNPEMAFYWYGRAHSAGSLDGTHHMACCYADGCGTDRDLNEAARLFTQVSERGCARSKYRLGMLILHGEIKSNLSAATLCSEAARDGFPQAMTLYGRWLTEGMYVPQNRRKGFSFLVNAAYMGDSAAMYLAGKCYELGIGTEVNKARSAEMYRCAALNGNLFAQYEYALLHPKDKKYMQAAAANGEKRALELCRGCLTEREIMQLVAETCGANISDLESTAQASFETIFPDCCDNTADSAFFRGIMYEYGFGVHENLSKAVELYKEASPSSAYAMYRLHMFYESGYGTARDSEKADILCRRAAESGYAPAVSALADRATLPQHIKI